MHSYLHHLLSNIAAACREEIPEEEVRPQAIEEHFEEIDRWIEGENATRFIILAFHTDREIL